MPLLGLKVLLVEDEVIVALMVEQLLDDLGCRVVGPAGELAEAFALA
jgi:CheY-like chemotaxis protein